MENFRHPYGTLIPMDSASPYDRKTLAYWRQLAEQESNLDDLEVVFLFDTEILEDPECGSTEGLDHGGRCFLLDDPWEAIWVHSQEGLTRRDELATAYGMGTVHIHEKSGGVIAEIWPDVRRKAQSGGVRLPFTKAFVSRSDAEDWLGRMYRDSGLSPQQTRMQTRQVQVLAERALLREVFRDRLNSPPRKVAL
ncbi:hypothetical protein TK90_2674 (plasmid) [Thioalkalivibrio sp. K90mix]|uniref:hypothetical protein n=1 Tax=Thioalkalivibrio sp. (strain K90mix) TaxID=396595 RepID=UPI000195A3BF|nr:hypothetical protein [Thioalkalivibrio sp. K90mix]ADC73161.1 hypothetical protein TK90_2674 [Thioalkalivibrio sp. K90mix]